MKTDKELDQISDKVFDRAIDAFWDSVMGDTLYLKGKDLDSVIKSVRKDLINLSYKNDKKASVSVLSDKEKNRIDFNI